MATKTRSRTRSRKSSGTRSKARSERRTSKRSQLFASATLYTEVTPDSTHQVWVTNISISGLGFKTRREYNAGESYHIRLDAGPVDMDVPIRIAWTRRTSDGLFEVGAEFLPD